jgi:hypothetical protein
MAEAEALVMQFEQALAELRQVAWPRRQVLYLIWREPWMGISRETYISRMLALVGWETLSIASEARYPELQLDKAFLDEADLVLFSTEPYRFLPEDLETFARDYGCPLEKLRLIDGEMTSWYGSRAIQGLQYLQQLAREY